MKKPLWDIGFLALRALCRKPQLLGKGTEMRVFTRSIARSVARKLFSGIALLGRPGHPVPVPTTQPRNGLLHGRYPEFRLSPQPLSCVDRLMVGLAIAALGFLHLVRVGFLPPLLASLHLLTVGFTVETLVFVDLIPRGFGA